MDDLLAQLMRQAGDEAAAMIARAYDAIWKDGFAAGEKAQRERMLQFLGIGEVPAYPAPPPTTVAPAPIRQLSEERAPLGAGQVAKPLREAILAMNVGPSGVKPNDVVEFMSHWSGPKLDRVQVHAALKSGVKRGEFVHLSWGRFGPSPQLVQKFNGSARPHEFAAAAE